MYTRPPQGRFPRGMRIPQNYSGNTFRPTAEEAVMPPSDESRAPQRSSEFPSRERLLDEAAYDSPTPSNTSPIAPSLSPVRPPCNGSDHDGERCEVCEKAEKDHASPGFRLSLKTLFPNLGKDGSGFGSEELLLLALILLLSGSEGNDDLVLLLVLLLLVR